MSNGTAAKAADDELTESDIIDVFQRELGLDTRGIDRSTPLFSAGLIDSFSLVSLLLFLETRSGITIQPMDVTLANFDSIDRMLAFVARAKDPKFSAGG